jgi:hypothetical protein
MSRKSSLIELKEQYEKVLEGMYVVGSDDEESIEGDGSSSTVETPPVHQPSLQPVGSVDNSYEEEEEMNEIEFVVPKKEVPMIPQKANCVKCGVCHDENEECEDDGDDDNGNTDMAKSELFKIMNYVKNIENSLKSSNKMEAWMLSKIIKAADYLCSVNGVLQYDAHKRDVQEPADDFQNDMNLVSKIGTMLTGESKTVNEEVLKRAIFNLEIIKSNEQV